jgi:nucleoside triphosphate diphosphatase
MDSSSTGGPPGSAKQFRQNDAGSGGPFPPTDGVLDRALSIVSFLREHCPWDRGQTARSLVPHLLEEAHETVEAIQAEDPEALRGELGDLLLNLAFQVVVAEEAGSFTRAEVLDELEAKMVRRHPHLFGGTAESWEAIKAREREGLATETGGPTSPSGALDGLAKGLDPLLRAHRIQERASGVGFDWDHAAGALEKVREELEEVAFALSERDDDSVAEEIGDLLFAVVNLGRLAGAHAVPALDSATRKFQRRFRAMEGLATERGVSMPGASLNELDQLWDEVKERERP